MYSCLNPRKLKLYLQNGLWIKLRLLLSEHHDIQKGPKDPMTNILVKDKKSEDGAKDWSGVVTSQGQPRPREGKVNPSFYKRSIILSILLYSIPCLHNCKIRDG